MFFYFLLYYSIVTILLFIIHALSVNKAPIQSELYLEYTDFVNQILIGKTKNEILLGFNSYPIIESDTIWCYYFGQTKTYFFISDLEIFLIFDENDRVIRKLVNS